MGPMCREHTQKVVVTVRHVWTEINPATPPEYRPKPPWIFRWTIRPRAAVTRLRWRAPRSFAPRRDTLR